ncbi:MAG: LysR family transcriptional regulator [Megasphaera sp.]|jgi:DNA-binding transcriptional LysR family regulator|nr:LysR family transcriptional regulator [Megasphaera sp.]
MVDIQLVAAFVAFADTGTLTDAAKTLHTSQPALTRMMNRLEDDLGLSLFIRTKNHLTLTETGQYAVPLARRLLGEHDEFTRRVRTYERSLHTLSIGYCAPIPQQILTPIINSLFHGMTLSVDMTDDGAFLDRLRDGTYQLAVVHDKPKSEEFYYKPCGAEKLYLSLRPSDPLSFYPVIHLQDLEDHVVLLFSEIGFWLAMTKQKTPKTQYLLQIQRDSFEELASHSDYPCFTSSYFIKRKLTPPGRINIPLADSECQTTYYLTCLKEHKKAFQDLFRLITPHTIS